MSLNRKDRLRLIGFDESFDPSIIGQCINEFYDTVNSDLSIQPQSYHGSTEFKLKGYPFHSSGKEAIETRRLIIKVLVSPYLLLNTQILIIT